MTDEYTVRVFMSQQDVYYEGGLVPGARLMSLFGDASTALLLENDGIEGLLATYEDVRFMRPVRAGDMVEMRVRLDSSGKTSRRFSFEASVGGEPVCEGRAVAVAKPLPGRDG